jgi:ribosomal protein S18 acetylase RimI-like enzyme
MTGSAEMMDIRYLESKDIRAEDLATVFQKSGINRPYEDLDRMQRMIDNCDLLITAWIGEKMIGVARALTDYSYCCYLSDLAVEAEYQKLGIGKKLVDIVRERIGEECSLVLIAAPGAVDYYPRIGFEKSDKAYLIKRKK